MHTVWSKTSCLPTLFLPVNQPYKSSVVFILNSACWPELNLFLCNDRYSIPVVCLCYQLVDFDSNTHCILMLAAYSCIMLCTVVSEGCDSCPYMYDPDLHLVFIHF